MAKNEIINYFLDEGFNFKEGDNYLHFDSLSNDIEIDITSKDSLHISNYGGIEYHTVHPNSLEYVKKALELYEIVLNERGV